MKRLFSVLVLALSLGSCTFVPSDIPALDYPSVPFVVHTITRISETHSVYADHYYSYRGSELEQGWYSVRAKICLPTGLYNVGDTITIKNLLCQ